MMAQLKLQEGTPSEASPMINGMMREKTGDKTPEDAYSYSSTIYHSDSKVTFPRTSSPIYSSPAKESSAPDPAKVSILKPIS